MSTITERTDKLAIMRHMELVCALADLVNAHLDLPPAVVAQTMIAKAYEFLALSGLPHEFRPVWAGGKDPLSGEPVATEEPQP